jgi:hypothetical protein
MSHSFESFSSLYVFLQQLDLDAITKAKADPCAFCGGQLDRSDIPRKPRGAVLDLEEKVYKYSLCCREEGCRRRNTPASLRFMGRKVFLGFFILFASSLPSKREGDSILKISGELEVSPQTLTRWLKYWREQFKMTPFWRREQGLFTPPYEDNFACLLISRFNVVETNHDSWAKLLNFLAPCFIY